MSQQDPETNVDGDGQQPAGERTLTQSEVNRIIEERLTRERQKYSDYEELRQKAQKLNEIEESQKSELQKALDAKEASENAAQQAIEQANQRLIQAEFIAAASKLNVAHPEDAYRLANRTGVVIGEDGQVSGVGEAVQALVDAGRLVLTGKPKAANLDGGSGGGDRPQEQDKPLTPDQKAAAAKMKLTEKEYRDAMKI
jgi:hypothetical protein